MLHIAAGRRAASPCMARQRFFWPFLLGYTCFLLPERCPAQTLTPAMIEAKEKLIANAVDAKLDKNIGWLKLLHYKRRPFGGYKSQADGKTFFLARHGKANPKAELIATINGFFSLTAEGEADNRQHARCRFPARFRWLSNKLAFPSIDLPHIACPETDAFRGRMQANSATMIFSSYYLNNPSSAFGHTFLRLNRDTRDFYGQRAPLLDYGINYAATVNTSNPIAYALMGIFGGFHGTFTAVPFYFKVREYNDYERRDLWGYALDLSPDELALLVDHIWELGSTYFRYFYAKENCSYHMLTLLEAVRPDLQLSNHFPVVALPADTIRIVAETPGLVSDIEFRPSIFSQLNARLLLLTAPESKTLRKMLRARSLQTIETESAETKAKLLDTAIDYLEFRYPKDLLRPNAERASWKQTILVARAQLAIRTLPPAIHPPLTERPHAGHRSKRLELSGGTQSQRVSSAEPSPFVRIGFRLALHDLLDPSPGYPSNAQVEFVHLQAQQDLTTGRLSLQDSDFFRVMSLNPIDPFKRSLSWRARAGVVRIRDDDCNDCQAGNLDMGLGIATHLLGMRPLIAFAFADLQLETSQALRNGSLRVGVGPDLGILVRWGSRVSQLTHFRYQSIYLTGVDASSIGETELRWHGLTHASLTLKGSITPRDRSIAAGVMVYF